MALQPSNTFETADSRFLIQSNIPPELTQVSILDVLNETGKIIDHLNNSLGSFGIDSLTSLIQRNNFSGIVSNILTKSFHNLTPYRDNSDHRYPDLIGPVGLEVKCTVNPSKGGESHNGHAGWHVIASYEIVDTRLLWTCVKFADLEVADWKYCGSKLNDNGSQRTETYTTTPAGRAKLLDGICYLNTDAVPNWRRWRGLSETFRARNAA